MTADRLQYDMIALRWILLIVSGIVFLIVNNASVAGEMEHAVKIRVMTFNLEDVQYEDTIAPGNERLARLASVIQRVRPHILLLNEIETRQPNPSNPSARSTASAFIHNYLMIAQGEDLEPINFASYTPMTNTGIHSGHDLDHSGTTVSEVPRKSLRQTQEQRAYGGDCFGFGGFPGQYGMALLVDPQLAIDHDAIRTFQHFLWKDLPNAIAPTNPDGTPYYTPEEWAGLRLSSKTFADIPIRLPDGSTIHALISHPTPPAFDGPEHRNQHRNRDEIRLLRAYIENDPALYDDEGSVGGLDPSASFVILGDLNADPVDGSSMGDPINEFLLKCNRIAEDPQPRSDFEVEGLDPTDTSGFKLRVDYVLPSSDITILETAVWRYGALDEGGFGSDHFPVWMDLIVPSP